MLIKSFDVQGWGSGEGEHSCSREGPWVPSSAQRNKKELISFLLQSTWRASKKCMPWQKCFCCKRKVWRGGECHILPTKVQQQQPSSYSPVRDAWDCICPFPLSSIRTFQNGGHWMYPSGLFLETESPSASQADPELAFTPGCPGTRDSLPSLSLSNAWIRGMSRHAWLRS